MAARHLRNVWMLSVAMLAAALPAQAQQQPAARVAHIGYVYPAGGQRGTNCEITVGGQYLDGASGAIISGEGVTITVSEHFKPVNPGQAGPLRDRLKELLDKKKAAAAPPVEGQEQPAWTDEDEAAVAEIRKALTRVVPKPSSPAIAESLTLRVEISPDAQPGPRELRLITPQRATNPMTFCVGTLPEYSHEFQRQRTEPRQSVAPRDQNVELPAVVNGQIMAGGVDRIHFQARKGTKLVAAAAARALVPYIADAVPGWFQATLKLLDDRGNELAYVDDYSFHPDPVLYCVLPADGRYTLVIHDAIYRGREDFVYRLAVGELPWVTSIYPLGGPAGQTTALEISGWNLDSRRLVFDATDLSLATYSLPLDTPAVPAAAPLFMVEAGDDIAEREANNQPGQAQEIRLGVAINGRVDRPGDVDVFRFQGRAGQSIVAEVFARRLNSPVDSALVLTDAGGRQIAAGDDHPDPAAGLLTHHADARLTAVLPADGEYYLHLREVQGRGGAEYAYRLRVGPPQPDFKLRAAPSSLSLRRAASEVLTVHVLRRDGFDGPVSLSVAEGPAGLRLSETQIPAEHDTLELTLSAGSARATGVVAVRLQGVARIDGRTVVRPVVAAEDMMQAFFYHHLVPAQDLLVSFGRFAPRPAARPTAERPAGSKNEAEKNR